MSTPPTPSDLLASGPAGSAQPPRLGAPGALAAAGGAAAAAGALRVRHLDAAGEAAAQAAGRGGGGGMRFFPFVGLS